MSEELKKSSFGLIPLNWEEVKLNEVVERVVKKNKNNESNNVLTISAQDGLVNQKTFFNKLVASKNLSGYYLLEKGDFAYNKSYSKGYPFGAIKPLELYDDGVVSTLYICFRAKDKVDNDFLKYYFESDLWHIEVSQIAQEGGRSHGLLNVSVKEFFEILFLMPSKKEQQKIAEILSTVDTQIEQTKLLIEKTKDLKKGLMQQLLTKGIEHTEFKTSKLGMIPVDWEESNFKKYTKVNQGLQIPIEKRFLENADGRYFYITNQFLKKDGEKYFIENPQSSVICNSDDILMTRTGNTGIVVTGVTGVFHNNFFKIDFNRNKFDKMYLVYYLRSHMINKIIMNYAGSTTIPDLNHSDFYRIPLLVPPIQEQQKIAEILSIVDAEIEGYEQEKAKYEELKKGLMQQLLTGKIRVMIN